MSMGSPDDQDLAITDLLSVSRWGGVGAELHVIWRDPSLSFTGGEATRATSVFPESIRNERDLVGVQSIGTTGHGGVFIRYHLAVGGRCYVAIKPPRPKRIWRGRKQMEFVF
jgi:hypothetical protein